MNNILKRHNIELSENDFFKLSNDGEIETETSYIKVVNNFLNIFYKKYWEKNEISNVLRGNDVFKLLNDKLYIFYCIDGQLYESVADVLITGTSDIEIAPGVIQKLVSSPGENRLIKVKQNGKFLDVLACFDLNKFEVTVKF